MLVAGIYRNKSHGLGNCLCGLQARVVLGARGFNRGHNVEVEEYGSLEHAYLSGYQLEMSSRGLQNKEKVLFGFILG